MDSATVRRTTPHHARQLNWVGRWGALASSPTRRSRYALAKRTDRAIAPPPAVAAPRSYPPEAVFNPGRETVLLGHARARHEDPIASTGMRSPLRDSVRDIGSRTGSTGNGARERPPRPRPG